MWKNWTERNIIKNDPKNSFRLSRVTDAPSIALRGTLGFSAGPTLLIKKTERPLILSFLTIGQK